MAVLTDVGFPTLVEVTKRMDPNGKIASIAELLSKELNILEDIPWVEGNLPTGHRITDRTALPGVGWRRFNEGVLATKSGTAQFDETCGMLEALSKVDEDLAALNGNSAAFRMSEAAGYREAINQELARALFYESVTASPEKIHGLSARYPATTGYTASGYTLKGTVAGGAVNRSIWLINWDQERIFGIYPKGSQAGLKQEDLGKQVVTAADGSSFVALMEKLQWKCGLAVRDYRYAVRYQVNLDGVTDAAFATTAKGMAIALQRMIQTVYKVGPHARFYMDRGSFGLLNAQLMNASANLLEWIDGGGQRIPSFLGVPIRITDALNVGEAGIA